MTVTAEMYRSRVADVLNLTTDNDRLRSELQRITDIAKASTTANSLPNIAKIASDALAGASVPAPQPPVEGLREALEPVRKILEYLRNNQLADVSARGHVRYQANNALDALDRVFALLPAQPAKGER